MSKQTRSILRGTRDAVAAVLLIMMLKLDLGPWIAEHTPFLLFHLAVVLSAVNSGLASGLFATVLAASAAAVIFIPLDRAVAGMSLEHRLVHICAFMVEGAAISWISQRMRTALRAEQLKAEEAQSHLIALRASEERYRLLFDASPLPMWVFDPDSLAFLAVNDAAARHYGYSHEEFLAMTIVDVRPEAEGKRLRQEIQKAGGLDYDLSGAWKHRKKDGTIIDVETTSRALTFWGRPARIVLVNDVTERNRAEVAIRTSLMQVKSSRRRLKALSQRLVEVQEAERRRLARELHDEVGQLLTGLKLSLESAARRSAEDWEARLIDAKEQINGLIARVRSLSLELRPTMLDDLGLLPTLLWQFERYTAQTGVQVLFEHAGLDDRFRTEVETAAYRITQEALTNVARHAGVAEVSVRAWADRAQLGLRIEDRGHGFDTSANSGPPTSSGLSGMRERAILLGGKWTLASAPGSGTRLSVELPLLSNAKRRKGVRHV